MGCSSAIFTTCSSTPSGRPTAGSRSAAGEHRTGCASRSASATSAPPRWRGGGGRPWSGLFLPPRRLVKTVQRHFPAAADAAITHHWGGPLAVPRDWSMSVSFDARSRVGWAGGYSGHGVGASNTSGRTLADLALGRDTDLVTLPWVEHRSRRWEPEPLRFGASRAIVKILGRADEHEDATGRRSQLTRLVAPFMPPR